ncbi:putative E3 ubiquitin-protein ligase LIN-1 [Cucumis melo var. makuwa]|uniref:E3 ubiquitin-protein ligase LIN-1 n=1 Tax=Cucumis melo var. makuwa TaxID=1194695 RepID=A0A5A7UAC3_CUCMM|nr:putative E3 ubiquitin-protein ligase LIN-1 [Cucumis melo var. makuwa]
MISLIERKGQLSSVSIPQSLGEALSLMAYASVTALWDSLRYETELVGSASTESRLPSSPYLVLSR